MGAISTIGLSNLAPRREATACWPGTYSGWPSCNGDKFTSGSGQFNTRAVQRGRIGMAGPSDLPHVSVLHAGSRMHDHNAIADIIDERQVVRNEQNGQTHFGEDALEQCHNFRLDGDIEPRRRLIGDQQFGTRRNGTCNHHALSHAA